MMNNGRPLSMRRKIQYLIIVTILCWATQTLVSQWSFGAEPVQGTAQQSDAGSDDAVAADAGAAVGESAGRASGFVPASTSATARLEFREQAMAVGSNVTLRQVCQWGDADAGTFEPIGDLVLGKFAPGRAFYSIEIAELRQTLRDAGVNMARIQLSGAMSCTVTRSDVTLGQGQALQQWIDTKKAPDAEDAAPKQLSAAPADAEPTLASDGTALEQEAPYRSLRQILLDDLARNLNMDPANLLVEFKSQDDQVLRLTEPQFKFEFAPRRAKTLGQVGWDVSIVNGTDRKRASIVAFARAWQQQVVVTQPVSHRQVIRDEDVIERRTLVDRASDATLLTREQTVGQMASLELRPGMIMTGRMVDAVPLARRGQLVTITLREGTIELKSVGRALENGSYGQTIRVKNETTGDIHQVVLTGPQSADLSPAPAPEVASNTAS